MCVSLEAEALFSEESEKGGSVIKGASPGCKLELRKALRFAGRYELW